MKKGILIALCLCMGLCLFACAGSSKPKDMDQSIYDYGRDAVTVSENYLAGKIGAAEAYSRTSSIYEAMRKDPAAFKTDANAKALEYVTRLYTDYTILDIGNYSGGATVKEDLDGLKKVLGL